MTQLSRYKLLEKIGSSTLGAVYKAQDTATGSLVALKVLQLGLLDDVSSTEMDGRLQRDYEAAIRLQHPGIARVFEIRRDGRTALIATELVEGPPITSLARTTPESDLSQIVAATVQLLDAVDFAHNQLVIHRDLKPSNVLIQGGRIKITDFGMADLAARNRTDTGALVGETEYMAPEQFLSGTIDKRCDIHAVGTIFYELLTGTSPFRGDPHSAAAMFKVLDFVPPPPSQVKPGLPRAFDSLVGRALAKKPEQRLVNARLFRNELCAAYLTVRGRAPPESLVPVGVTPLTASYDAPRTTIVQSRAAVQSPRTGSQNQAELARASAVFASNKEPSGVSAPPRSESSTPATASRAATPQSDPAAAFGFGSSLAGESQSSPAPFQLQKILRPGADGIRVQPAPVAQSAGASSSPSSPMRDTTTPLGPEEPVGTPASPELTRVELPRSEPRRAAPLPGGTVLARPKLAIAPSGAVDDAADLVGKPTPPEPAPPQPPQAVPSPLVASVEAPAPSREVVQEPRIGDAAFTTPAHVPRPENGSAPERQESARSFSPPLPASPAPAPRAFTGVVGAAPSATRAEMRPYEVGPPSADSMPMQRTRATSFPPKRIIPLTDESIARGGRVLAQFVGPIAIVFSRRAAQDAHDDERVYFDMLAAHLSDPDERAQFFRKLRQKPA
jgi:eukaryotic-like serine/threonine-protein kinase